jgi:hypothetical protein
MHITIFFHEYKVLCLSSKCFLSSSIAHRRIRDDAYQIGESRIVEGVPVGLHAAEIMCPFCA